MFPASFLDNVGDSEMSYTELKCKRFEGDFAKFVAARSIRCIQGADFPHLGFGKFYGVAVLAPRCSTVSASVESILLRGCPVNVGERIVRSSPGSMTSPHTWRSRTHKYFKNKFVGAAKMVLAVAFQFHFLVTEACGFGLQLFGFRESDLFVRVIRFIGENVAGLIDKVTGEIRYRFHVLTSGRVIDMITVPKSTQSFWKMQVV